MRKERVCYCDWACGHPAWRYVKDSEDYKREWESTLLHRILSGKIFAAKKKESNPQRIMTTATQRFIEKAIGGGWKPRNHEGRHEKPVVRVEYQPFNEIVELWFRYELGGGDLTRQALATILLDPEAWKAAGKVEGWRDYDLYMKCDWKDNMHRMIDALASGKSIEEYLTEIV